MFPIDLSATKKQGGFLKQSDLVWKICSYFLLSIGQIISFYWHWWSILDYLKMAVFIFFLVWDLLSIISVFSPKGGKYEPGKLWIQTLFRQCRLIIPSNCHWILMYHKHTFCCIFPHLTNFWPRNFKNFTFQK